MIRGVKFVGIPVSDQERALAFYTDVLGFRLLTDQPFNEKQRWLELGIPGADTRGQPYGTTSIFKDVDGNHLVLSSK